MVIEFQEQDISAFDEVMEVLKRHPGVEHLRLRDEPMVSLPGLEIYPNRHKIYRDRREINLTAKEFDLIELLATNPSKVYSRENLLNIVWGYEYPGDARTVDVHIRRLREKIEKNPSDPKYVHTKWGVGDYFRG